MKVTLLAEKCVFSLILLMEEILHQLVVVYPIIYRVFHFPGGAGFLPSTVFEEWKLVMDVKEQVSEMP